MSDAAKSKAKQKWAIEKPKLDNARQLRGIFFIEPDDEEFKHTMKNARRKLEIPMPAAMPCSKNCGQNKSSFRVIDGSLSSQESIGVGASISLKYKGRVVLRGDIVKDDLGSYAVFAEQGSSASQMTAAKVMDIISRLPGCAGQGADAVSAYTQVKMEDAATLLKIPKSECPDIWIRPTETQMA